MYKLRFYKKSGADKGNLDHEEFFDTLQETEKRFKEVFVYEDYSLNPTIWTQDKHGNWFRIMGY